MTEISAKATAPAPFDIDAMLGELKERPLTYRQTTFMLPGELPGDCLAPFLSGDLGLVDLITSTLADADDDAEWDDLVLAAVKKAPTLPGGLLTAANESFKALLGDEQYAAFRALRPSVQAWALIARSVIREYGFGFADFFASSESSDTAGEPSKATSSDTTISTPEGSGDALDTPTSSD